MASTAQEVLMQALEQGGFIKKEGRSTGLFDAESIKTSMTTDLRYHTLFEMKGTDTIIDFVYETPGQSTDLPGITSIYFKALEQPTPEIIKELRSQTWNHGKSPTLWIATTESIRIYDGYARPREHDTEDSHLLEELKCIQGHLELINEFHKASFDSGEFWKSQYGTKLKKQQRVDMAMLGDLTATEDVLIRKLSTSEINRAIPPSTFVSIVHALLGRTIFVAYLEDRGLLDKAFFQKSYRCNSFKELLDNQPATYAFFHWLRETFNGDLFPIQPEEEDLVTEPLLELLKKFLSGSDMRAYAKNGDAPAIQLAFWPYKFDFIPIELISSIYEKFAHTRNANDAEANSVHYTRLPLVELLLSLAMRNVECTARVLDPACGSGVFLTEAFRRLVWKRSNREGGKAIKRDELHAMLRQQIFGIDIDRDAIHVTAFSLYLTLLELDPDPQPLEDLKFPSLLRSDSDLPPNLYVQDFCNTEHQFNSNKPFSNKSFDLIVGNPPWTALKPATASRDPENPDNGRQWGLDYCTLHNIPDKKPDQAFLIRSQDFAHPATTIAFIVCSRLFYQQEDPQWLHDFLSHTTVDVVVNLSDLVGESILFGGNASTRLPASILFFKATAPSEDAQLLYLTPKWYPESARSDEIKITAKDIGYLPQTLVREQPFLWKSAFRGSPRDYRLLNKLEKLSSFGNILIKAGLKHPTNGKLDFAHRGVIFGNGRQHDASALLGKPFLAAEQLTPYRMDIDQLSLFSRPTAERSHNKFLDLPAVILGRSLYQRHQQVTLAEPIGDKKHLVINQMYYGIPYSQAYPELSYKLNALLNSHLAFYMAFMFSSALGWDRKLIEVGDWWQVRLPESILEPVLLESVSDKQWITILTQEKWLRTHWSHTIENIPTWQAQQEELNRAVYQLYNLSAQEIMLVEDTLRYEIKPLLAKQERISNALVKATPEDLQKYAQRVCEQLDGVLTYANIELTADIIVSEYASPLRCCRFTQKQIGDIDQSEKVQVFTAENIEAILEKFSEDLRAQVADRLYTQRNLRVYNETGFWIIKDNQKSLWSEAAALNDADTVLYEHLTTMEEK